MDDEWLTAYQRHLIELVACGLSNAEIAQRLDRSPATVRNRLSKLYARTGTQSRVQLIGLAISRGWVDPAQIAAHIEPRAARVAAVNREIRRSKS